MFSTGSISAFSVTTSPTQIPGIIIYMCRSPARGPRTNLLISYLNLTRPRRQFYGLGDMETRVLRYRHPQSRFSYYDPNEKTENCVMSMPVRSPSVKRLNKLFKIAASFRRRYKIYTFLCVKCIFWSYTKHFLKKIQKYMLHIYVIFSERLTFQAVSFLKYFG